MGKLRAARPQHSDIAMFVRRRLPMGFFSSAAMVGMLVASLPIAATARPLALVGHRSVAEPSSVLGLEGNDDAAARTLTDALRRAFAARGVGGGQEVSLEELKLTIGCDDESPTCLSEGGKTLGVEKMVYGRLKKGSGGYKLDLRLLDVQAGTLAKEISTDLSVDSLDADVVDDTAKDIVDQMLGAEETEATTGDAAPAAGTTPAEGPGAVEQPDRQRDRLVWGRQKPTPAWKWAGFGVSLGLSVVSLGTAIGTTLAIREGGPVRDELIDEANKSLEDDKPENNVDPNTNEDLCALARTTPENADPGTVTNASVTKVCNKADALSQVATATWITGGVFAASTIVFTVLIFVHREKGSASAMHRHRLRLGAAPLHEGGFVVGGGLNF